jgi:hypothetical protein
MTTNWSQEEYDCSTQVEREAERSLRIHSESLVAMPTLQIDRPLTNRVEAESVPTATYSQRKMWFVGWDVMLAALAGVMVFFLLNVASFGVLGSAVAVAGIVAVVGLGHYLLWGRVFAGRVGERRRSQNQARRPETSVTEPPDEFLLGLNYREQMELLQLLEHSSHAVTEGREESEDSAAIRRGLQDKIRMFGA